MVLKLRTEEVGLRQSIDSVVNSVNRRGLKIRLNANDFSQPLGRITQKADEFTKSLEASNARVIAFGASAAIIGGVAKGFEQLVVQAVKFEKLLTDINVVLGTSSTNLAKFGDNLFKVARNTSQALDVAAEAALEFSRQGLSMEETLKRTNDALILTRLTGIKAADAVSGLTAAVNGFADAGLTTTSIINKLAAVDVKFAVSADDLINALARAGAVAQDAGVNFDQLVGAVTSAQQITARGGAVIGNSFKTIFTRIQRSSTLNRLQELGIAVRDIRGATLPALTVLTNLSKTYDTLGSSTKAAVAEQVGGVFQINVLKAALKDLNRENSLYAQATQISNNATDQAQQKNAQLQKTLSSLATQTSLTIQELSANIGDLALSPGISKLLDALNSVGTFLNDSLGKNSEGIGSDIGKGLVRGIGSVITGPGMVLAFGIFAKLFANAFKFAKSSLKDVLGIVTQKDKERKIQESIVVAMQNNKNLAQELGRFAGDKLKQEELIFAVIKRQTENMERQANLAKSLAPGLARRGVNPDLTLSPKRGGAASGFIPNFSSSVTPFERAKERGAAVKSGYTPGNVSDINIKGVGRVVYNTAETVKKFPGMQQPAIMPPQDSDAGKKYKYKFAEKHGFNPYAFNGFVPNFADPRTRSQKVQDALNDPANKNIKFKNPNLISGKGMDFKLRSPSDHRFIEIFLKQKAGDGSLYLDRLKKISGYNQSEIDKLRQLRSHYQNGHPTFLNGKEVLPSGFIPNFYDPIKDTKLVGTMLNLPLAKMLTETNVTSGFGIKAKKMTGLHKIESPITNIIPHATTWADELSALQRSGVTAISRMMQFSNYDSSNKAARTTGNFKNRNPRASNTAVGDKFEGELYKKHLKGQGYSMTVPQGKVDFIKPGATPIESKFNKIESGNLIAKSIRLYRDRAITNYLKQIGLTKESSSFKRKNFEDSLGMLKSSGINTSGSLKDQVRLVRDYNVAQGLIPSFAGSNLTHVKLTKKGQIAGNQVYEFPGNTSHSYTHFLPTAGQILQPGKPGNLIKGKTKNAKKAGLPSGKLPGSIQQKTLSQMIKSGDWHLFNAKSGRAYEEKLTPMLGPAAYSAPLDYTPYSIRAKYKDPQSDGSRYSLASQHDGGYADAAISGHSTMEIISKLFRAGLLNNTTIESYLNSGQVYDATKQDGFNEVVQNLSRDRMKKPTSVASSTLLTHLSPHGFKFSKGFHQQQKNRFGIKQNKRFNIQYFQDAFNPTADGLIPNFADNYVVQALAPKSGFYKNGNFVKDKNQAEKMSRSRAVMVSNILMQNRKIKSRLFQMNDGMLMGDSGIFDRQKPGRARGFVPNFTNPLAEAVRREKQAGLPASKIRIDQDSRLKSKENPLGLAVTNTRDEPLGVQQGIERARAMGIDPKTHGASGGFVPNFSGPQQDAHVRASKEAEKGLKGVADSSGGLMMGMFALTSMTYALEGAIGEAESAAAKYTKVFNSSIMGLSQSFMIYSGLSMVAQNMSKGFGIATKSLGAIGAVAGTLIPIYQAVKENTTWLDSGLDTLRKSASKTAKGIDALGTAISSAEGIEATRKELAELNTGAMAGTYQGEMQRLKLNAQLIKQQSELAAQSGKLGKQLNLTESEIKAMTDGTASGMKKLQEAMLQAQQQMAVTNAMSSYVGAVDKEFWSGKTKDPLTASLQKTNLAAMAAASKQGDSTSLNKAYDEIDSILKETREIKLGPYAGTGKVGESYRDLDKAKVEKEVSESDLPVILKAQIKAALDGKMSMADLAKFFEEQKGLAGKFTKTQKEQTKESEGALEIMRQIKKARQETLNSMELGKIDYSIEQNLQKLNQSHMMQEMSYRAKLNDSLGILSNSASIDIELKNREQQIQNDYINQKSAINRETVEAQQKLIKDLFAGGGSFKPEEMFADLGKSFNTTITQPSSMMDSDAYGGAHYAGGHDLMIGAKSSTPSIQQVTYEGGTKEAFEGNLKEIIKKLEKAGLKELAAQLEKTEITKDLAANQDHANQITLEYLSNLDKTKQIEAIRVLQAQGIISKTADIESVIQQILDVEKKKLDGISEEEKQKRKNLALVTKELNLGKQTAAAAQERLKAYREIATSEKGLRGSIQEQLDETLSYNISQLSMNKNIGETTRSILMSEEHRSQLALSMQSIMEGELTNEVQSLVNQEARLKAEQELRKNTELYSQMMAIKAKTEVGKSIIGMQDSAQLDSKTLEEEKKQKKFAVEAETNLTKAKNAAEREQLAFNEKLKAGGFQLDALNEMAAASRDFTASMIKAREKLAAGEFFNEGVRSVEQDQVSAAQGVQKAQGKVAATQGNSITNARAMVELTEAQRELNIQQNAGTLFADSMAVKMAEANKELAMFGQTLAETSFDAMRDGFRGLFDDLIDGSKSAGDAALNFFAGIAKKIQDKLLDRASTQLAVGFSDMLGLDDIGRNNSGGLIKGYAKGGTVGGGKVPSMLTAGEYVVKKKIVDRLGSGTLDSINQTGSLDELYNKPNEDIFDITTEGAATIPPIMRFQDGGNVASYLTQRNMGYDRVSENERSTVNGEVVNDFTNALDSVFQKHSKQNVAGKHEKSYNSTYNNSDISNSIQHYNNGGGVLDKAVKGGSGKSGLQNIAEGGGYMIGSYLGTSQDPGEPPKAPEAPKNQRLNTRSRLNLDAAGADRSKMSQRFIANDSYTKEMKKYHLDMYEFHIQQKNQKEKERAGKIANIAGTAAIAGGMALAKGAQKMYGDYKHNQNMKHIDNAYTQMNIDNATASSMFDKSISDANKTLSLEYHTDVSSLKKDTIYGNNFLSADTRNYKNSTFSDTMNNLSSSKSISGGHYSSSSAFTKNYNSSSMFNSSKNSFASTEMENYLSNYDKSNQFYNTSSFGFEGKFNKGGVVNNKTIKPYSYYNKGGVVNVSNNPYSYFNKGGSVNNIANNPYSYFNRGGSVAYFNQGCNVNMSSNPYSYFNKGCSVSVSNNPYSYFNRGGSVRNFSSNPYSYFNQGGSVYSNHSNPYSYFNSGGSVNNVSSRPYSYFNSGGLTNVSNSNYSPSFQSHSNIQKFSGGGKVNGPGGIDKVGPVLLDKGEYVIKASSVNKVEKKYPGFFDKLNSSKMKDGGKVGAESTINNATSNIENSKSSDNNSVVVNINISSNGSTSVDGGSESQQAFASKIKDAVTGIISQEKRVGGMLRGK